MIKRRERLQLFSWDPQGITLKALITGAIIAGLSVLMPYCPMTGQVFIRDILMILAVGIYYPLSLIKAEGDFRGFGFTIKKWYIWLPVNLVLGMALFLIFLSDGSGNIVFLSKLPEISYIMLVGIFEVVAFYAFIQKAIEHSFGPIVGIIVAAAFYSMHHAGFQPEFGKLFVVGLMYAAVYRMTGSALSIYPFFWGIGATWDVLVQSQVVSEIAWPLPRAGILLLGFAIILFILRLTRTPERVIEGGAILDEDTMSTDEYSAYMIKQLGSEYRRFAKNVAALDLPQGARVLEIGPGPGWAGIELLKLRKDIELTGLEPSPDMRRTAMKNALEEGVQTRVEYVEGYAEDLSRYGAGEFDTVISRDSLHHWVDPGKAFLEIDRVLKPTGLVHITDSRRNLRLLEWSIVNLLGKKFAGVMYSGWKNSIGASYTPREIREIFTGRRLSSWRVKPVLLDLVITRNDTGDGSLFDTFSLML